MDGEIIARVERRRQWTPQEKAALLAEVEATGGRVSVVARRRGCGPRRSAPQSSSAWRSCTVAEADLGAGSANNVMEKG